MEFISLKNKYKVRLNNFSIINNDILINFYLPLIGSKSYALYNFLFFESKNIITNSVFVNQERITNSLNITLDSLKLELINLEHYNLINIYTAKNKVIIVLEEPYSFKQIFLDNIFTSKLKSKVKDDDLKINKANFEDHNFDSREIEKFIHTKDVTKTSEFIIKKKEILIGNYDIVYDFLRLINIDYSKWSKETFSEIKNIIIDNHLNIDDISNLFLRSKSGKELIFLKNIRKNIITIANKKNTYSKENLLKYSYNSKIELFEKFLETTNPIEYVKLIFSRPALDSEMKLIETLKNNFDFSNKVINLLINYSKNVNDKIVNNYIIKISETLSKNNIVLFADIMEHLKNAYNSKGYNLSKTKSSNGSTKNSNSKIDWNDVIFD